MPPLFGLGGSVAVDPLLDAGYEGLSGLALRTLIEEGGNADLYVLALGSAGYDVGIPGVASQDRHGHAVARSLVDYQRRSLGGYGGEEYLSAAVLGGGDVGGEVGVALGEGLASTTSPPRALKASTK